MNDDCKYTLTWCIGGALFVLSILLPILIYNWNMNKRFIDNGYQQTMVMGYSSPIWQKR